ncbi:MAG: carbohydrate ABC transporter permease, partial [Spirochaetaceae bacterium]
LATGGYNFGRFLYNSAVIAVGSVLFALVITIPAAYSIVRYRGFGDVVLGATLIVRLMPALSMAIPVYVAFSRLGLIDTHLGIMLMHTLFISPTALLLLIGYVQELPRELEDAAIVDGATSLQFITRVLLPVIQPGISAVAILGFILSWNEFIFAVVLSFRRVITATVGTSYFITSYAVAWGPMAAAISISSIPTMIFIFLTQQKIIQGMTAGAVKG